MSESKKMQAAGATEAKADGEGDPKKGGALSFLFGWIALPGAVLGGLFGLGVFLGVNGPDAWYTRFVRWLVELI